MKAKIAIAVSALLLGTITTANADLYIQSPVGLTQAQWNASDAYKNFTCPAGYGRGEGIDMNFTTSRADDYWFVSCTPIVVTPTPIYTTTPTPVVSTTPAPTETSTVTVTPSPAPTPSPTTNTETTTAVTETTTATSASVTVDSLYAQIMALFTQLLALIAKLGR
jgi:cell division septation protein DedD